MDYPMEGEIFIQEYVPQKKCDPRPESHILSFRAKLVNDLMYIVYRMGLSYDENFLSELISRYTEDELRSILEEKKYDYSEILVVLIEKNTES